MKPSPLWLLTGPIGAGKTTFCRQLAQEGRARGWQVAGLLSPAQVDEGRKTGILLEDVRSGEQHRLAVAASHLPGVREACLPVGRWLFDPQTLCWGNQILAACPPCDLLIIDELGPLEFNAGEGLSAAFNLLDAGEYKAACVIIRPTLLDAARTRWPWATELSITDASIHDFW